MDRPERHAPAWCIHQPGEGLSVELVRVHTRCRLADSTTTTTRYILDDFREAYYWLRHNTKPDARIMSWWDYGYQITAMGNRTIIVDNNTWNNTHIATVRPARGSSSSSHGARPGDGASCTCSVKATPRWTDWQGTALSHPQLAHYSIYTCYCSYCVAAWVGVTMPYSSAELVPPPARAQVGRAMASSEEDAYEIMRRLDVDYVLVIFGGLSGYSSDDINKFLWMVRIGGGVYPEHIKEADYLNNVGGRGGGAEGMLRCQLPGMCAEPAPGAACHPCSSTHTQACMQGVQLIVRSRLIMWIRALCLHLSLHVCCHQEPASPADVVPRLPAGRLHGVVQGHGHDAQLPDVQAVVLRF